MTILFILMVLVAIVAVAFALRKPRALSHAELVRIENQAILRAEAGRQSQERLAATLAAQAAESDDLETITIQVTGRGRRKNAEGFEILGKGWAGRNNKDGSPFCYFPVLHRNGAPVGTSEAGVVVWAKLYDEMSDELLAHLEGAGLPTQVQLKGELMELKKSEPFQAEDGTIHVNWRFSVTEAPVLVPAGDPRWVFIRRDRKVSRKTRDEYMPRAQAGREILDLETIAQLKARLYEQGRATTLASEGASDGIPVVEATASEPSFGCSPVMD